MSFIKKLGRCIKDFFDYNLLKGCRCKTVCLKLNFLKDSKFMDGLQSKCKSGANDCNKNFWNKNPCLLLILRKKFKVENWEKMNEFIKNKMKTDLHFELAGYMRNLIKKSLQILDFYKAKKIFDSVGCSHSFFENWITHQILVIWV